MWPRSALSAALLAAGLTAAFGWSSAHAATLCTVIANVETGEIVVEKGDCRTRVTPASTFKIPLALIGFDSGFLIDARNPTLPFREGFADWGGAEWKKPTDPVRWLKYSVVWYSQAVTASLGRQKFADYVRKLDYGNADVSGDPNKNNGLERAWIGSSLKISPVEQVMFLRRLLRHELPVSADSIDKTLQVVEASPAPKGWSLQGKTGSAFPRNNDGSLDRAHGWGWFVGWMKQGEKTFVFARLAQDTKRERETTGLRAKASFLKDLPGLTRTIAEQ